MFQTLPRLPFPLPGALALAMLSLMNTQAWAAQRTVYTGTLQGAGVVVMELDSQATGDGVLTGRYFYPKHGVDIPLKGTPQALREPKTYQEVVESGQDPDSGTPPAAATWQGKRDASGFQGTWTDARTGKQRAFTLRRVAEYDPEALAPDSVQAVTDAISGGVGSGINADAGINSKTAPYESLKLAGHAVPTGADSGSGPVAYRMWRDPRTKFSYPRLSRHPDPQVLARINALLEQRHWQMSLAALACKATIYTDGNPAAGTLGSYEDEAITVDWLSPALMTVIESGSLYCGGAHPNNHFDPYTFDLLRGEYLDWNRVFDAYVPGDDGWRKESPALMELVDKARKPPPASNAKVDDDDTGLDECSDLWPSYLALGAESPGVLSLSVSGVGHAMGVCLGTHATVPFKDLEPYLKPGGKAYLVGQ
ncbi:hypothetical protein RAS12_04935 [Achromobacter seleniivolatilans]|uniref:Secreted protein n=1 Tax=Achromobacter seleniivolatilans TaxID=3047478 RepID=A0ABY9M3Z7_9BURK|nr:hypothetical protein [Achromobacter sp. R39]WMD21726.1 hypothetical protein RAS12_04935 [Achromobacter sp. R39]